MIGREGVPLSDSVRLATIQTMDVGRANSGYHCEGSDAATVSGVRRSRIGRKRHSEMEGMQSGMIEKAKPEDAEEICRTILDSFHAFVAPDYSPEGIEFFHSISTPDECARRLAGGNPAWIERGSDGAVDGYIELRDGHHVTRFFVAPDRIGIGIGKALHKVAESHCRDAGLPRMTVFSSPFALGVYERLGYVSTGAEESPNGLRFVPMEKSLATVAA